MTAGYEKQMLQMNMEPNAEPNLTQPKAGIYKTIFHHPNFNVVIGIVGTLLGCFGVYSYYASNKEPNLTYYVSPTRTAIVQKGALDNFSVNYQGLAITGDLSSAEIQIWNQGKLAIKGGDILNSGNIEKTISIKTLHGEPIYTITEATTRPEIAFKWVANADKHSGVIPIDWKILEQGDGIKLQIIYGGNVSLPILVDGVNEGQKSLTKFTGRNSYQVFASGFVLGIIILGALLTADRAKKILIGCKNHKTGIILLIIFSMCYISWFLLGVHLINYFSKPPKLPF